MSSLSEYEIEERGQVNTASYRVYLKEKKTNKYLSPFHDVPLVNDDKENKYFNAIIEIPRWSNAKMEINKKEKLNPIVQDIKNKKLRYVNNVFPYHGYIWNYGALPQTWEDPNTVDETTGCNGDNDPLDICEIGSRVHECGSVVVVKVLGALGLIDDGEADWKLIVIDVNDPLASKLNDINDVETEMPGLLDSTRDWFRVYKIPTGKLANKFACNGRFFDKAFALELIQHNNESWLHLVNEEGYDDSQNDTTKEISLTNTTLLNSKSIISSDEANRLVNDDTSNEFTHRLQSATMPIDSVQKINFVDRSKL